MNRTQSPKAITYAPLIGKYVTMEYTDFTGESQVVQGVVTSVHDHVFTSLGLENVKSVQIVFNDTGGRCIGARCIFDDDVALDVSDRSSR